MMALVGAWLVGPRLGRFAADGAVVPMTLNSIGLAVLGVTLLWVGWWGFNGGSTLAFDRSVAEIIVNTNLAASAGGLIGFVHARFVQKQNAAEKLAGGILGGLVAITASCHLVSPTAAIAIGALAAILLNLTYELLLRRQIDDPVGAIPIHLACGIFGVLAVPLFAPAEAFDHGRFVQLAAARASLGVGLVKTSLLEFDQVTVEMSAGVNLLSVEESMRIPTLEQFDLISHRRVEFLRVWEPVKVIDAVRSMQAAQSAEGDAASAA